ncbi:MAG TPA: hypothetical protein VHR43_07430 [Gemmatimonadales bacterium]|jgi:hypothetical protein|nr:hypothetical protein [Gemmatimonadales bacterium]
MLDELRVESQGKLYVGHVWAGAGPTSLTSPLVRWCFAHHGHIVAEFPATALDTPETVKARLLSMLGRRQARELKA